MPDALILPLRHGLQLTISGAPALRALGSFLKAAIVHFKNQRDIQQRRLYTAGSFQGRVAGGDCAISYQGDSDGNHLPPAAWAEAVLEAYRSVAALEQLRLDSAPPQDRGTDGPRGSAAADLASAATDLQALRMMLERSLSLEAGDPLRRH